MERIRTTPHCGFYCWKRTNYKGREIVSHYHGNAKRKRFHKKHAKSGLRLNRNDEIAPRHSYGDGPDRGAIRTAERGRLAQW